MALQGYVDEISCVRVFGWAINTERPREPLKIIVCVNGEEKVRGLANLVRKGLREYLGGEATGSHEFDIALDPPLSVFRDNTIEVFVEGFEEQLPQWKREITAPKPSGDRFTPIILTSTGRSGSTFLMGELGKHRQVVSADSYPYEIRLVAYYSAAYRALVSSVDRVNSTDPDTWFDKHHKSWIGHNPYNNPGLFSIIKKRKSLEELFDRTIPARFSEMFQRNIEDYYALIKRDQRKTSAAFFAEKGDIDQTAREGARLFFSSVREVVLVRDPRDMLCSAKAFWRLSDAEALEMLTTTLPRLEQIRKDAGADSLFVRYEDLLSSPVETRSAVTRFIGIEDLPKPESSGDLHRLQSSHGTSRDAGASIGRWRNDLSASEIHACEGLFKSYMELFDYPPSERVRAKRNGIDLFKGSRAVDRVESDIGAALLPVLDVAFKVGSPSEPYLVSGWYPLEREFVWSSRSGNVLHFNRPEKHGKFRLRLVGRPFVSEEKLPSQRVAISINGELFGEISIDGYSVIECDLPWDLIDRADTVTVCLECPDAARPCDVDPRKTDDRTLGFALQSLVVFGPSEIIPFGAEPPVANQQVIALEDGGISLQDLMLEFESLGENCEFGLVQRRCDVDPLGLFRFSSAPLDKLMAALKSKFKGMGKRSNLEVQESSNGREYMVLDKQFGFLYHAWVLVGEKPLEEVEMREARRLPLLVRKLIDTITLNEKIFVYHGMDPLSLKQASELSGALRAYGPATLLWMELADEQHAPGTVEQIEPGLLKGYMDRFAPGENAHDLSLDCWVTVCRNAYRIWKSAA